MSNKYLAIYDDIFPNNNNDLKINNNWLIFGLFNNSLIDINLTKENIINLIDSEYVIFPTDKFYHYKNECIKYLRKTQIVCINYYLRYTIIQKINFINKIIKSDDKKYLKLKSKISELLMKDNIKPIYFLENEILPNTLYRKIKFGQEEVFMSFNIYAFKRIEYKLKTICELVEKMGAIKIDIRYAEEKTNNLSGSISSIDNINIKASNSVSYKKDFTLNREFNDINQINNINLNIYELKKIIEKENEFYISKEQFEADIDIKFLLNSRCVNLVEKYNTKLVFEYMNKFERQLKIKTDYFGLDLDFIFSDDAKEELFIDVLFLDPFKYLDCINGYNISPYASGFNHLSKLIKKIEYTNNKKNQDCEIISTINCNKKEKDLYLMINYFLESHMKLFNEKKNLIDLIYNNNIDLYKSYNNIINKNFSSDSITSLFYYYFKNNLTYKSFEIFRNILIKSNYNIFDFFLKSNYLNLKIYNKNKYTFYDNILYNNKKNKSTVKSIDKIIIDDLTLSYNDIYNNIHESTNNKLDECYKLVYIEKMIFISYQYHNILDYRLKIMDMLDESLEKIKIKLVKTCNIFKLLIEKESSKWRRIFKAIQEIENGNYININYIYRKFKIDYSDRIKFNYLYKLNNYYKSKFNNTPRKDDFELKKFYDICKYEYDKNHFKSNKYLNRIKYNNIKIKYYEIDIQKQIKNYYSKTLLDISSLIKYDCINNNIINIEDFIPSNNKYLNQKNTKQRNSNYKNSRQILLEPKILLNIDEYTKFINNETFLLGIICFCIEKYYEEDDLLNDYNLENNFNKIQLEINHNYDSIVLEIKKTFDNFFYKENGFFNKTEYNNNSLKNELIKLYNNNKISDLDECVILIFHLLFEDGFMDLSKLNNSQSIFDSMYLSLSLIIKNYENYTFIKEAAELKYIKKNFPLHKLIINYQRFKIFFTYEDFSEYFRKCYNNDEDVLNDSNILDLCESINNIKYKTLEKIIKANRDENFNNINKIEDTEKNLDNYIEYLFYTIYNKYNDNPLIMNLITSKLNSSYDAMKEINENKKNISYIIEKNTLFIKLKNNINKKNINNKSYFLTIIDCLVNENKTDFDGSTDFYILIKIYNNEKYLTRLTELIINLILNKLEIPYIDLNNDNYNKYIEIILEKLKN